MTHGTKLSEMHGGLAVFALDVALTPSDDVPGYVLWMGTSNPDVNNALSDVFEGLDAADQAPIKALGRQGIILALSDEQFNSPVFMESVTQIADSIGERARIIAEERQITFLSLGNVIEEQQGRLAKVIQLTLSLSEDR